MYPLKLKNNRKSLRRSNPKFKRNKQQKKRKMIKTVPYIDYFDVDFKLNLFYFYYYY